MFFTTIIILFTVYFISPVFAVDDKSFCNNNNKISVNYHIDYGNPVYKSVSNFPKERNSISGYNIKGLTDINYKRSYDIKVSLYNNGDKACLMVSGIDIYFGFPEINVLIYDRYPMGSCEYSVIKNHENKHVKIYQSVLKYYSEEIGRIIYNRIKEKKSLLISDVNNLKSESEKYIFEVKDFITSDENLNKVENKMMKEIEYQNSLLDSKENYDKTKTMCNNW